MIVAQEISYREYGSGEGFTVFRIPDGSDITLRDVVRGVNYEVEVRNVDHTGRLSAPATFTHTVSTAAREGALALPTNVFANIPSTWDVDTSVSFSADSSVATISVSAGTFLVGGQAVSYAASSGSVAVTPGVQKTFYMYYDDPRMQGGALPLGITDDRITSMAGNYRIAISSVKFIPPNPGDPPVTGGGGIGGGGGGNGAFDKVIE